MLEEPQSGYVRIDGIELPIGQKRTSEIRKRIIEIRTHMGMVFQEFNLFPHRTIIENVIEGPLVVKGEDKKSAVAKGEELLNWVGLIQGWVI